MGDRVVITAIRKVNNFLLVKNKEECHEDKLCECFLLYTAWLLFFIIFYYYSIGINIILFQMFVQKCRVITSESSRDTFELSDVHCFI